MTRNCSAPPCNKHNTSTCSPVEISRYHLQGCRPELDVVGIAVRAPIIEREEHGWTRVMIVGVAELIALRDAVDDILDDLATRHACYELKQVAK